MVASTRSFAAALVAIALATARAHIPSHDNILRIQLWDAEGLSRDPITTQAPAVLPKRKLEVNLESLNDAMLEEWYGSGKFTKHRVRHKRRRPRHSGDFKWQFHSGVDPINVRVYDPEVSLDGIQSENLVNASAVSDSASSPEEREVSPPMKLRLPEETEEVKQLPVVPKCCASGQNLSVSIIEGTVKTECSRSSLTFQPTFHKANETHIWSYDSNVYETIVGNPCSYDRYKLEPDINTDDEFYLLVNGSLFVPFHKTPLLGTKDYCMETFYEESNPAGTTVPLVCFPPPIEKAKTSTSLKVYAFVLLLSVPFLLATAAAYLFIKSLRNEYGKALACYSICLAVAFFLLATAQLASHIFPVTACTVMAYCIQFTFLSSFLWLSVIYWDMFLNIRQDLSRPVSSRSSKRRFLWYCAFAVLIPLIILIITVGMHLTPAVPSSYLKPILVNKSCWYKPDNAALPYFYGPVAATIIFDIILISLISKNIRSPRNVSMSNSNEVTIMFSDNTNQNTRIFRKYRKQFRGWCIQFSLVAVTWVFEIVMWAVGDDFMALSVWSLVDLFIVLQGVSVFYLFVIHHTHVRAEILQATSFCTSCRRTTNGAEALVSNV